MPDLIIQGFMLTEQLYISVYTPAKNMPRSKIFFSPEKRQKQNLSKSEIRKK